MYDACQSRPVWITAEKELDCACFGFFTKHPGRLFKLASDDSVHQRTGIALHASRISPKFPTLTQLRGLLVLFERGGCHQWEDRARTSQHHKT
jgi:hypothetical protein